MNDNDTDRGPREPEPYRPYRWPAREDSRCSCSAREAAREAESGSPAGPRLPPHHGGRPAARPPVTSRTRHPFRVTAGRRRVAGCAGRRGLTPRTSEPRRSGGGTPTRASPEGLACVRSCRRRDLRARDRRSPALAPLSSHTVRPVSHITPRRLVTRRRRRDVPGRWPEPWCGARCAAAGRGAGRCSISVRPATVGRPTVGRSAARPRNASKGGGRPPSISAARKAGSITGTANGSTARNVAAA